MVSFIISLVALVLGYLLYGKFVAHVFGPDDRPTPAVTKADGVDFMVLPSWKIFMIQFLNIAGTGPIFGAIMGCVVWPRGLSLDHLRMHLCGCHARLYERHAEHPQRGCGPA